MKPREILNELDKLGVTIWHQHLGDRDPGPFLIRIDRRTPSELKAEIERNTAELLKISAWKPAKTPGIYIRKPRQP